jgi:apolipoprotein N-acyltransferase
VTASPPTGLSRRLLLLALAAAAWSAACWLPFHLAPLLPIGFAIALHGLRQVRSGREALLYGLVFGAFRQGFGAYYVLTLTSYSLLAPVLLLMDMAYMAPYGMLEAWGAWRLERRTGLDRRWCFVLIFPLLTWTRTLSDMSQPTDMVAHAFGTHPQWLALTGWTGPYLLPLVAVLAGLLLESAFTGRAQGRRALALGGGALLIWLALPAADLLVGKPAAGASSLRVGLVQPSVPVTEKMNAEKWPETWEKLERLTAEAAAGADLVIWPETVRPGWVFVDDDRPVSDPRMEELARRVGVPILYGCQVARRKEGELRGAYNAAALARPDGSPGDWYGKQRLLPFVEGVPFADWFGWDPAERKRRKESASQGYLSLMGNLSPGPRATIFEVGEARIGVLICYEGLYPHLVRRYRREGANVLAVLTNDAWFGRTAFPRWHALMVAARARESGAPVVRAANTGVCSVTDARGRMQAASELMEVTTLQVELTPAAEGSSFYARTGELLVGALWLALGVLVLRGRPRGESAPKAKRQGRGARRRRNR